MVSIFAGSGTFSGAFGPADLHHVIMGGAEINAYRHQLDVCEDRSRMPNGQYGNETYSASCEGASHCFASIKSASHHQVHRHSPNPRVVKQQLRVSAGFEFWVGSGLQLLMSEIATRQYELIIRICGFLARAPQIDTRISRKTPESD